jgi:uncharacterized membrane protein YccC
MNLTHAFKTGLAAGIAALVYLAVGLPHGFWAVVSAVVVMQANIGASFKASWSRLIGTFIGACIGAAMVSIARCFAPVLLDATGTFGPLTVAFGAGAAVALTGALCMLLRLKDAYRLAGVTCAIVLLVFADAPWESALHRTLDVSIGVVVALAVTLLVFPSRARRQLHVKLGEVVADAGELCRELTRAYLERDYPSAEISDKRDAMKQKFRDSRNLLSEAGNEPGGIEPAAQALFTGVERVVEHVLSLDQAARNCDPSPGDDVGIPREDALHKQIAPEIGALCSGIASACAAIAPGLGGGRADPRAQVIEEALSRLNARLLELRQAGAARSLPLDEMMRFYGFVESLLTLGRGVLAIGR